MRSSETYLTLVLWYQILERVNCVLWISGIYTSRLLDAAMQESSEATQKGMLVLGGKLRQQHQLTQAQLTFVSASFHTRKLNTSAGNPVKEILLKLNLLDHKSILTDSKEYIKRDMEVPDSS
ncbi:hypothetical protein Tco_1510001 [Tanacetum coccineum]